MNNNYSIKKNIDKIKNGGYTDFLNPGSFREISYRLKKDEYKIYKPYGDADKIILYTDNIPKIRLFEIISYYPLSHSEILGSLFGLNITDEVFGDIIIWDNKYYFFTVDKISNFIKDNLVMIGNKSVKVKEVDLNTLDNYKKNYEEMELIVSSLRLDTVLSRIIGTNRDKIKIKMKNKEIVVNYKIINNNSYNLHEGDVFSIRRYGKYKYIGIVKMTKKDNYIIKILRYI
ncbi:MAG: YlmH/Sll1252 family protein [Bacilli bacterium]|nr:YlmH/Sll1252 family protein [Bacilli bacterium]